ncbi:hypothetical protein AB0F25_23025 [Streptomyces wedmorensis]|uniref:hypothetical protein n=1 Tax=Streptomyces wedmorensis TaxID=43759 RepID=UPI00342EEB79
MRLTPTERDRPLLFGAADLLLDSRVGGVRVDGRTGLVPLDGSPIRSEAAGSVSPNRLHFL